MIYPTTIIVSTIPFLLLPRGSNLTWFLVSPLPMVQRVKRWQTQEEELHEVNPAIISKLNIWGEAAARGTVYPRYFNRIQIVPW